MEVNNNSLFANLINKKKSEVSKTSDISVSAQQEVKDTFEKKHDDNEKNNLVKYSLIGGGILLAVIAFVKRNAIAKFIRKIFKKGSSDGAAPSSPSSKTPTVPPIKSGIPEPKFTCGMENPAQFTLEKEQYVDSLIPKIKATNTSKEDRLKVLNAIEKYGSWKQGEIAGAYCIKDDDIVKATVKVIAATADNARKALLITKYIRPEKYNYKTDTLIQILKSAAQIGDVRALKEPEVLLEPMQRLLKHENAEVRKVAEEAIKTVTSKTGAIYESK